MKFLCDICNKDHCDDFTTDPKCKNSGEFAIAHSCVTEVKVCFSCIPVFQKMVVPDPYLKTVVFMRDLSTMTFETVPEAINNTRWIPPNKIKEIHVGRFSVCLSINELEERWKCFRYSLYVEFCNNNPQDFQRV